jgi:hypothetical protein
MLLPNRYFSFNKRNKEGKNSFRTERIIECRVLISFITHFQVAYQDEFGSPRIKELMGDSFVNFLPLVNGIPKVFMKVFVTNDLLRKGQSIKMSILENDKILKESEYAISENERFDGWFKIEI